VGWTPGIDGELTLGADTAGAETIGPTGGALTTGCSEVEGIGGAGTAEAVEAMGCAGTEEFRPGSEGRAGRTPVVRPLAGGRAPELARGGSGGELGIFIPSGRS
jgi:hypothetical protein